MELSQTLSQGKLVTVSSVPHFEAVVIIVPNQLHYNYLCQSFSPDLILPCANVILSSYLSPPGPYGVFGILVSVANVW